MPIYAYKCDACGHEKDVLQKVSDALLSTCPACGAEAFRKQVTAAGFQLKGSGWYATDFRGGGAATKKDEAEAPAADKAPATSADKPAEKAADKATDKATDKAADKAPAKSADKAAGSGSPATPTAATPPAAGR